MFKKIITCIASLFLLSYSFGQTTSFSTAGFHELQDSGREVYGMNIGWRFQKGACDAWQMEYADSSWSVVSLPHGLELLPEEASGSLNYQGEAWYRKSFELPSDVGEKKLMLHFEGVMGKSKYWLNGKLLKEHFGGFLPVVIDITDHVLRGKENILAVCADNSDDPLFPPGRSQATLDFCYFGGIYRDCWLVAHNDVYITDPNYESEVAGGGLFVHLPKVSDARADMKIRLHVRNESGVRQSGKAGFILRDRNGNAVAESWRNFNLRNSEAGYIEADMIIDNPDLWSPESPRLYSVDALVADGKGNVIDGYTQRVGMRSIEFRGEDGFWLNGKPYERKLIGVNRHQDFAIIGNALPNSLHWRDVKKLKDAGVNVIRSAHYPQDPAFMDVCDELGVFVIVATPGWQFWNKEPVFETRVLSDIRNMVRRDRNHPCVLFWEPVLNETHFPEQFALKAKKCVEEESPYAGGHYTAIDPGSNGSEHYPIIYSHPITPSGGATTMYSAGKADPNKVYFTREFGDNVDDWNSHNSNSRVHRSWGEIPMLIQAEHYASPVYGATSLEKLYSTSRNHVGGTLWHSFDHQRGYHPQPFYGGLMDSYRQPKTSYYMFMAQSPAEKNADVPAQTGPMVYVAHEMTPFSPKDVTVYSNCEEVRLTVFENGKQYEYKRSSSDKRMPSPIIVFEGAYDFMEVKSLSRRKQHDQVYILAEGFRNGEKVAEFKRSPSLRPAKIVVRADSDGLDLKADGSDIVVLIAELTDAQGNVKRLSNYDVKFSIEGQGRILHSSGDKECVVKMQWGIAPVLVQATHERGDIIVKAEIIGNGVNGIESGVIKMSSFADDIRRIYDEQIISGSNNINFVDSQENISILKKENVMLKKRIAEYGLRDVEILQEGFGE